MSAVFDFIAERPMIDASETPHEVLDWIGDYRRHALDANADDDSELATMFDELIEYATDHVVELKAARLRSRSTPRSEPAEGARAPAPAKALAAAHAAASVAPAPNASGPDSGVAQRREAARRRAEENAAERAAADEQARSDDEELRQLQERAAKARARRDAALAETARIEAEATRVAAEAARTTRDEARRRAAKEAQDAERAAATAEAATKAAAASMALPPAGTSPAPSAVPRRRPAEGRVETPRPSTAPELTPLAALFQESLAEVMVGPEARTGPVPPARSKTEPPAVTRPDPATIQPAPLKANGAPAPPPTPADGLPPLTGADLTSFRNWLAVSQRALVARLGVEQSSISKGEGKPTTVLPPQLRKALHLAMQEPREAAKRAS